MNKVPIVPCYFTDECPKCKSTSNFATIFERDDKQRAYLRCYDCGYNHYMTTKEEQEMEDKYYAKIPNMS